MASWSLLRHIPIQMCSTWEPIDLSMSTDGISQNLKVDKVRLMDMIPCKIYQLYADKEREYIATALHNCYL